MRLCSLMPARQQDPSPAPRQTPTVTFIQVASILIIIIITITPGGSEMSTHLRIEVVEETRSVVFIFASIISCRSDRSNLMSFLGFDCFLCSGVAEAWLHHRHLLYKPIRSRAALSPLMKSAVLNLPAGGSRWMCGQRAGGWAGLPLLDRPMSDHCSCS